MTEAHITVKDSDRRLATIVVQACKHKDSARAIAEFIDTHSAAEVIEWKFVDGEPFHGRGASGKYDSVDQQNVLVFGEEEGVPIRFVLPAPADDTLDDAQNTTPDFAGLVLTLLSQQTELDGLIYHGGGLTAHIDVP